MSDRESFNGALSQFGVDSNHSLEYTFVKGVADLFSNFSVNAVSTIRHGEQDPINQIGVVLAANLPDGRQHRAQGVGGEIFGLSGNDEHIGGY